MRPNLPLRLHRDALGTPRLLVAGLKGSGGKTMVAVGLAAAWSRSGVSVAPFKKGADYIDASWLSAATGKPCRNLDLYMLEEDVVYRSFQEASEGHDLALIEGNRGLYDGMNVQGSYSSAELSKILRTPVILVVDAAKSTRTVGALVLGCQQFDTDVDIGGVVLNRVAGPRHEQILCDVIDEYCGIPVVGVVPTVRDAVFPERHLGLVPPQEHGGVAGAIDSTAEIVEKYLDLDLLREIAERAAEPAISSSRPTALGLSGAVPPRRPVPARGSVIRNPAVESETVSAASLEEREARYSGVRIGVLRDEAFQFYYPENLAALESEGGILTELSPLRDKSLPPLDALYIGGGFPETCADRLADNMEFRSSVAAAVEAGVPVYAECAGAIYLGQSLVLEETTYPMVGALPVVFGFGRKPRGHGYAEMEVTGANPFFEVGESFRGHEFHYSYVLEMDESKISFAFRVKRGNGIDGEQGGICRRNTLATYCHLHALGVQGWARALVRAGSRYKIPTF